MTYQPLALLGATDSELPQVTIIRDWAANVKWAGSAPTRMPSGPDVGKLAARLNGPGTAWPNETPIKYALAPALVLVADSIVRDAITRDSSGALLSILKGMGLAPTLPGNNLSLPWSTPENWEQFKTYALWGAIAIGAVIILPPLLNARRR